VVVVLLLRLMTMPGYLLGVLNVEHLGRRATMSWGFGLVGLCFCVLARFWASAFAQSGPLFLAAFGVLQVLNYAGAAVATYVIPGEIYTSSMRASAHGLSAAAGKLGAVIGSAGFPLIHGAYGLPAVFGACACVCALGWAVSELCIPSYDDGIAAGLDEAHSEGRYLAHLYGPSPYSAGTREPALVRLVCPPRGARRHVVSALAFLAACFATAIAAGALLAPGAGAD
jgi:hypothetical protein